MTRNLIVDGTKEIIANGVSLRAHAISNSTDYTHQRIVGYAVTLEDAHLFAAAVESNEANKQVLASIEEEYNFTPTVGDDWIYDTIGSAMGKAYCAARAAILKSEVR